MCDLTRSRPAYLPYGGSTQITTAGQVQRPSRVRAIDCHSVETRVSLLSPSFLHEKGEERPLIDPGYANNPLNECHSLINEFHIGSLVPNHPRAITLAILTNYLFSTLLFFNHLNYHFIVGSGRKRKGIEIIRTITQKIERGR